MTIRTRLTRHFYATPFRGKLTIAMLIMVCISLFLSSVGLVVVEFYNGRDTASAHNRQMSEVLASNLGAAVVFGDRAAAQTVVNSVGQVSDVVYVEARDARGVSLARYENGHKSAVGDKEYTSTLSGVGWVTVPIIVDDEAVGSLLMAFKHRSMGDIFISTLPVAALIILFSLIFALILGNWLKNALMAPFSALTAAMRQVRKSGVLSARVENIEDPDIDEIITSYNAMLADIEEHQSELAIAMEQLAQARDEAQAASVAKSAFLANMSHELRTPLNSIIGYAELVHEDLEAAGFTQSLEDVHWIETSSHHLLELINNLLDFSKIEAGRMELDIHTICIVKMMGEIEAILQPLAAKNHNRLIVNIAPDVTEMACDSTKLRQCLINLGGNANKFTENGVIEIDVRRSASQLILSVTDTGIGMSEEDMKKLFTPFAQSDSSITRRYGGTGLGLSLVKHFMDLMGGSVKVISTKGQGSTFTLYVPIENNPSDVLAA